MAVKSTKWLKSKFYPVDPTHGIIYDDPKRRERECSWGEIDGTPYSTHNTATIGIKGARILRFAIYSDYVVLPPLAFRVGQIVRVYPKNPDTEELMDCIGVGGTIVAYLPSRYRTNNGNVWEVSLVNQRELTFRTDELSKD